MNAKRALCLIFLTGFGFLRTGFASHNCEGHDCKSIWEITQGRVLRASVTIKVDDEVVAEIPFAREAETVELALCRGATIWFEVLGSDPDSHICQGVEVGEVANFIPPSESVFITITNEYGANVGTVTLNDKDQNEPKVAERLWKGVWSIPAPAAGKRFYLQLHGTVSDLPCPEHTLSNDDDTDLSACKVNITVVTLERIRLTGPGLASGDSDKNNTPDKAALVSAYGGNFEAIMSPVDALSYEGCVRWFRDGVFQGTGKTKTIAFPLQPLMVDKVKAECWTTDKSMYVAPVKLEQSDRVWWWNLPHNKAPKLYPEETLIRVLSAVDIKKGTFKWTIASGKNKMLLVEKDDVLKDTVEFKNKDQVKARSVGESGAIGDVSISLDYTGSMGGVTVSGPTTVQAGGLRKVEEFTPQFGPTIWIMWQTKIRYAAFEKLASGNLIPGLGVNEDLFNKKNPPGVTDNWGFPIKGDWQTGTVNDPYNEIYIGIFTDVLEPPPLTQPIFPKPVPRQDPLSTNLVFTLDQQFRLGSQKTGEGLLVRSQTLKFFVDHGEAPTFDGDTVSQP